MSSKLPFTTYKSFSACQSAFSLSIFRHHFYMSFIYLFIVHSPSQVIHFILLTRFSIFIHGLHQLLYHWLSFFSHFLSNSQTHATLVVQESYLLFLSIFIYIDCKSIDLFTVPHSSFTFFVTRYLTSFQSTKFYLLI